ncbi:M3 family oligoendopeptidase [Mammaliicoccus sciuri]|uniref:M3 family oligoendopeptidase n=1 Tax=Mammaliicoccus sciuri TaxID=1296 RepID=UPI002DB8F2B0|nr:M3 family oligoendopeptidase [Mammaliicoccus sciuri]MEB7425592.1 M3 family oligoendopeptidase [Mammaliicoccus sciuri]
MTLTFKDYQYEQINIEEKEKQTKSLLNEFDNAETVDQAIEAINEINKIRNHTDTHYNLAYIRASIDTHDEYYNKERDFFDETMPKIQHLDHLFYQSLLKSKFKNDLIAHFGQQLFSLAEVALNTYNPSINDLLVKENKLVSEYDKLIASADIEYNGEHLNLSQFSKYLINEDREIRKDAFKAREQFFAEHLEDLDRIYDGLVKTRHEIALKLGYENFVQLGYNRMQRIGYDATDVKIFREQVKEHVVPITEDIKSQHAKRIGVDNLKAYDNNFTFKTGSPKPQISTEEIVKNAKKMYHERSKETGHFIDFMIDKQLFDLEAKKGKESGGYCTIINDFKSPFIFANFNGTQGDIEVMTHEAGHAFQVYESLKYSVPEYYFPTSEACEIHSMSMEYLTYPWMSIFFKQDTEKFKLAHLEDNIKFLPYGVAVDEFQHFVYENPDISSEERRKAWSNLENKYFPSVDYDNIQHLENGAFWHRQGHIFASPFYYIDYTLATICAMQFFIKQEADPEQAWSDYLKICQIGGSQSFIDIMASVQLQSPFEKGTVKSIIETLYKATQNIDQSEF